MKLRTNSCSLRGRIRRSGALKKEYIYGAGGLVATIEPTSVTPNGTRAEAQRLYSKALEIDPGDAQANWRFGSYLKDIGDYEQARQYLRFAQELDPDDKRAKYALKALEEIS